MTSLIGTRYKFAAGMSLAMVTATLAPVGAPARAADNLKFSFCTDATESCVTVPVWNIASVTVTKVNVTQKSSDIAECEKIQKTSKQNMPGGDGPASGKFTFKGDAACKYEIKYVTTSGCIGDKDIHIGPEDMEKGKSVYLDRSCGNLSSYATNSR
jgi:hypothetical protein